MRAATHPRTRLNWLLAALICLLLALPGLSQEKGTVIVEPNPTPIPEIDPLPSVVPSQAPDHGIAFDPEPVLLSPIYLRQRLAAFIELEMKPTPEALSAWLEDLYLQSGYPGVEAEAMPEGGNWKIKLREQDPRLTNVRRILITGGTPRDRYMTRHNLHQREGQPFEPEQLQTDIKWIERNHFVPIELQLREEEPGTVDLLLHIDLGAEWIPTGNLSLNDAVGLAITAGLIVDNPLDSGQIVRAMGKRNNIPFPFGEALGLVQDWEYTLSWATTIMPIEGMSLGLNHYNKVDYIYPDFNGAGTEFVWIRSLGADIYSGFPIWSDPASRRYLRGVFNLSLIDDTFHVDALPPNSAYAKEAGLRNALIASANPGAVPTAPPTPDTPESLSKSGKTSDLLLMPSLTVSYSDIDDYRLPKFGNFFQTRVTGSVLDARFIQATLTGISVWSPYVDESQQWTVLLRSAAGSTFGANPPFYRGFLNTGSWLVRGATQYSITEKHSLRLSEELHYIYKPTSLQMDELAIKVFGQPSQGIFDGWAFDANVFLDQGAYWRDSIAPRSGQLSIGLGINAITPAGSILGVDLATPIYPNPGTVSAYLRISAPLSFTLYSDWGNTNGFFLR